MAFSIKETVDQSANEKTFLIEALHSSQKRIDGRAPMEMRQIKLSFGRADSESSAEVQLGQTRIFAVVSGEVVAPFLDRATEGFLQFNVELSEMACPSVEGGRAATVTSELTRVIERAVRDSQALDTESLCIIAGEKVWSIRCDIRILNHGGNLIDSTVLATMAALQHFRRPEVSILEGNKIQCHSSDEREPLALSLHHVPLMLSFALLDQGKFLVVDPTDREEEIMGGRVSFGLNAHKELCSLHKMGGTPMRPETLVKCGRLALRKVDELQKLLSKALKEADKQAQDDRMARLRGTAIKASSAYPSTPYATEVTDQMEVDSSGIAAEFLAFDKLHLAATVREDMDENTKKEKEEAQWAIFDMISQAAMKSKQEVEVEASQSKQSNQPCETPDLNCNGQSSSEKVDISRKSTDSEGLVQPNQPLVPASKDDDSEEECPQLMVVESEFKNTCNNETEKDSQAFSKENDTTNQSKQDGNDEEQDLTAAVIKKASKKKKTKKSK